jgi:hypothetical protein
MDRGKAGREQQTGSFVLEGSPKEHPAYELYALAVVGSLHPESVQEGLFDFD